MLRFLGSRRALVAALAMLPTLALAACGSGSQSSSAGSGHDSGGMHHSMPSGGTSPGMNMADPNGGLAPSEQGYTLDSSITAFSAGGNQGYRFRILGPDGKPHTSFAEDQTKLMHFYAIRSDLTNFQHLHPTMSKDGTWSLQLPTGAPGPYRVYASFVARDGSGKQHDLVLSRPLTVSGPYQAAALPPATATAAVDGYTATLHGQLMSSMAMPVTLSITQGERPVTDLQPYLETYAHVTAFRSGDLAFAHLHPQRGAQGDTKGGPDLPMDAQLPSAGDYRLFIQFQTAGKLHTAEMTVRAG
jgi:hypothetical protein